MSLANRCEDYVFENNTGRCFGTKERDICNCHGDRTLCDFYPEVREKAIKEYESEDTNQILKDFGVLDKDGKLSEVYRNIYELRKKQLRGHGPLSTEWGPTICEIELNGEKVDIILFSEDPLVYVARSLSPGKVNTVSFVDEKTTRAIVPDDKLSLAIGAGGINVKLAARLTGYKIDVKPESQREEKPAINNFENELSTNLDDMFKE